MTLHEWRPESGCFLPDGFWSSRPVLDHVRDAAWSRGRSPDAVLLATMCRFAALVDYRWVLPGMVGTVGSLNMVGGLIAPPGIGKSTAAGIAAELLPFSDDVVYRNSGSGEGVAAAFMREPPSDDEPFHRAVMLYVDEGSMLAKIEQRQGSTFAETLRTAAHGGQLGQQNATKSRRRHVPAHEYRLSVLVGFQPSNAGPFMERDAEGTPQRFMWAMASSSRVPEPGARPTWPGTLPLHAVASPTERTPLRATDTIRTEVEWDDHERSTGVREVPAIESHDTLTRVRLAGLFALLDGRSAMTDDDWLLARTWSNVSGNVRRYTLEWWTDEQRRQAHEKAKRDGETHAVRSEATDDARDDRLARRLGRYVVVKAKDCEPFVPSPSWAGRDAKHLEPAKRIAVERGWVRFDGSRCLPGPTPLVDEC